MINVDQMEKYYKKLLTEDREEFLHEKWRKMYEKEAENTIEIDVNLVKKAIMRMKNGRAAGPGNIPVELIKCGGKKLWEMMTILFNKIINGGKIPEEWKIAIISSIHKKGDKRNCENYRGISVTGTFSRIYGNILKNLIEAEYEDVEME